MLFRLPPWRRRSLVAVITALGVVFTLTATATSRMVSPTSPISVAASSVPVYLPIILRDGAMPGTEWTQHGANAQRTSYVTSEVPPPWRLKWIWNGPDATGRVRSDKIRLPRGIQPVTGGGRVYVAAGSRGVYALDNATGAVIWNRNPGGAINSTPAYDPSTGALFVVSSNGTLYKLDAAAGTTLGQFAGGASSSLPLPPAVLSDRVLFSMGNRVYAINNRTMAQMWAYDAGSPVHTPPSYSARLDRVIVTSSDLYVHAIDNAAGTRIWRVKPTPLSPGEPGDSNPNAEVSYGWPVIAEEHGLVLIKLRLNWQTMWTWNPWPATNAAMRSNLEARPDQQALHVLRLDNGQRALIANVGHGGFGDGGYMPMGPQPVIKRFANGQEVAYVVMRGSPCLIEACDGRGDSFLGEMVLDNTTVPGYQAGYVRYMRNTFFPTDEQANLSMAGDHLFAAHWEAGIAHRIVDRSAGRGSSASNPIEIENLPHIATSQDEDTCGTGFRSSHYCGNSLSNTRLWPGGFYIYWKQGAVYDQYWTEYAIWTVSGRSVYFLSTDGALVALEQGNPANVALSGAGEAASQPADRGQADYGSYLLEENETSEAGDAGHVIIPYTDARAYAGQYVTVEGAIRYIFNNGKAVYLGFTNPHQGAFKVRIMKEAWGNFAGEPERLYTLEQRVRVTGIIGWYQGDPVIYVTEPGQIEIVP
ncbi:MAG: outer membrane protein assembly factor BamB family protein [Roseiflexus sp.]